MPTVLEALRTSRTVDLTLRLAEDLPCFWPGAVRFRHSTDHWFETSAGRTPLRQWSGTPYHSCVLELDEHTGTHFDAPSHFIAPPGSGLPNEGPAGDVTAEKVPIEQFLGPAAVIDVSGLVGHAAPGCSPRIEPDAVRAFEAEQGRIGPGDIVLFRSRWDTRYRPGDAGDGYVRNPLARRSEPGWPAPSPQTVELLLGRGVRCLGTDGASMGPVDDGAPTHLAGLGAGMVFVEGLCRLDHLPARGATFLFLPLPVQGGSGGPGRAIAFV